MIDLYDAAALMLAAGLSIAVSLLWLRRLSRLHRQQIDRLLALQAQLQEDPLGTLLRHQQTLLQVGLHSLDWQGSWYGAPIAASLGPQIPAAVPSDAPPTRRQGQRLHQQVLSQRFRYDDISLDLRIGLQGLRGERLLFAMQAAQVLFAMLQGALAARQLALLAAVNQRAQVSIFLQHDMRNLAQWVELVADDFATAENDEQLMLRARRLRSNAALAAQRAQRMAQALLNPVGRPSELAPLTEIDLAAQILQAGQMHQVEIDLAGAATLQWDAAALATVLDNVLGNVSNLSRQRLLTAHCQVTLVEQGPAVWVHFDTPHLPLEIPLEKLFEPWASSGALNQGLGLYQARQQAKKAGADLYAQRLGGGIRMTLCVACKKS